MKTSALAVCAALAFSASALAQEWPMPKMFKGMQGKPKGQWQMEVLEGGGRAAAGTKMTICTDNLMKDASSPAAKGKSAKSDCKHKLVKDTAEEAVVESVCGERRSTMTMKRESAKSMLMTVESTTAKGKPQNFKVRYTQLGPCREGQGAASMDPNSEQCRQIKQQMAQMDPAKQCARQKADREQCEQRMRDAVAQLKGMCG